MSGSSWRYSCVGSVCLWPQVVVVFSWQLLHTWKSIECFTKKKGKDLENVIEVFLFFPVLFSDFSSAS